MKLKGLLLGALCIASAASAQQLKSDLPAVYITIPSDAVVNTETYVTTQMTLVDADGTSTTYADTKLRGRGSAKFALDKKPYKLKLLAKARLLGADGANAKKWNLMAQAGDKTLLRNAVASFIALKAGQPFAPGCRFVDLVINDEYRGTYQLTDQIDIRKKRVHITEQPELLDAGADISGGYLLEIDDSADDLEGTVFTTSRGVRITVKSPDEDYIVAKQKDYIAAHVQLFEDALFADNWLDPTAGYRKYIDLDSFIQWYITAEYTAEPNSFRSVYFYKELGDDRLTFGPVWDFDFAFDNSARFGSRPRALIAQEGRGEPWCYIWIDRLRQDPAFHTAVNEAWKKLLDARIVDEVNGYINQQAAVLAKSQALNFEIYPIAEKAHDEQHLFPTYAEGIEFLKQTQAARADFLTEAFATLAAGGTVPIVGDQNSLDEVAAAANGADAETYDLQGRRVLAPARGIYIRSGKAILIR